MYLTKDFTLSIVSNNINPFSIITEAGELSFDELLFSNFNTTKYKKKIKVINGKIH